MVDGFAEEEVHVIDELAELFRRQSEALTQLEQRLRALELVVASDEQRFVPLAVDELESVSERIAALELARVLALSAAGMPVDVSAGGLVTALASGDQDSPIAKAIEELRTAMRRTADARERAVALVSRSGGEARTRLAAASVFSAVG